MKYAFLETNQAAVRLSGNICWAR